MKRSVSSSGTTVGLLESGVCCILNLCHTSKARLGGRCSQKEVDPLVLFSKFGIIT